MPHKNKFLCIVLTAKSSVFPPGTRRRIRSKNLILKV